MFSSVIRFGIVLASAALLASCGGSSGQALTRQSTPEGLFSGTSQIAVVATTDSNGNPLTYNLVNQDWLVFMEAGGAYYAFYSVPGQTLTPTTLGGVQQGQMSFGGGGMAATGLFDLNLQTHSLTAPAFSGGYTTGINIAGTFTYSTIEANNAPISATCQGATTATDTGAFTVCYNIPYNVDYQGIQSLSTLAGTYSGKVYTATTSEAATFTFGPPTVPANAGNAFGIAPVTGTGQDGCTYTGTAQPLFKGNGYNIAVTSGGAPCVLPNTQFTGLVYLNTASHIMYTLAPSASRADALVFVGTGS